MIVRCSIYRIQLSRSQILKLEIEFFLHIFFFFYILTKFPMKDGSYFKMEKEEHIGGGISLTSRFESNFPFRIFHIVEKNVK